MLDYLFYRAIKLYKKHDDSPLYSSVMLTSVILMAASMMIFASFNSLFETNVVNFLFEKLGIGTVYSLTGLFVFAIPTCCLFVYIVYYRYVKKKRYIKLYWKYRNYKINRYFKGWMLFLIIPLCIFIPIILKQFYLLIELIFNVDLI